MKLTRALLVAAMLCGSAGGARAQFVSSGDELDQPAQQNVKDTKLSGRVYTSLGFYTETASDDGQAVSPDSLLYGDLRGRVQADHISGSAWDALGDLRIRFTPDGDAYAPYTPGGPSATPNSNNTARGYEGGNEYDLREAYVRRSGESLSFSLGRLILRDVDSMVVDGLALGYRSSASFEYGAAAGLFPNPYSRSLTTDYDLPDDDERSVTGYPAAASGWMGYRTPVVYGSVGVGAMFPRNTNTDTVEAEPVRSFVTAHGYARAGADVAIYHYGVFDFSGAAGAQLTNLQLGALWHTTPRFTLELAYSHMSTYAIETYLRDLLENVPVPPDANSPTNNLDVARTAADEGRVGGTYRFLESQLDVFGQVRFRRRSAVDTGLVDLEADTQLDVSAGVRKKNAFRGWALGANAAFIAGGRTSTFFGVVRGGKLFHDDRMEIDVDLGFVKYADQCVATEDDPVCGGTSNGQTIRAGAMWTFRQSAHWLFLVDYHLGLNSATAAPRIVDTMDQGRPTYVEHTAFLRAQYSF